MKKYKIILESGQEIYFESFLPQAVKILRLIRKTDQCHMWQSEIGSEYLKMEI